MGGRLDATNVVEPLLSVITDISLDHTEWLGPTIDAISREKAGILRRDGVMVTLPQHAEANAALGEIAVGLGVRGVNAADYIPAYGAESTGRNHYSLRIFREDIAIDSPLAGRHQQRNVALAISAAVELCNSFGYKLSGEDVARGVKATRWPGRLELFPGNGERADILLDVAHNPAGAWALRSGVSGILDVASGAGGDSSVWVSEGQGADGDGADSLPFVRQDFADGGSLRRERVPAKNWQQQRRRWGRIGSWPRARTMH